MIRERGNKYKAKKTACQHGHLHDSGREAKRCSDLHLMQRAGEISALTCQPVFRFVINGKPIIMRNGHVAKFTPDFRYNQGNRDVVEDVKSKPTMTEAYRLRRAIFTALFPDIDFREVQ